MLAMLAAVITDILTECLDHAGMLARLDHHLGEFTLTAGTGQVFLSH